MNTVPKNKDFILTRRGFLGSMLASAGALMSRGVRAAEVPVGGTGNSSGWFSRVTLSPGADGSREMGVAWRFNGAAEAAAVQFAPAVNDSFSGLSPQTVGGTIREVAVESGTVRHGRVLLSGLEPGKCYIYRVGDGSNWSPWYTFQTAGSADTPFSFLYVGDIQNDIRNQCTAALQMAWRLSPDARFLVCAGDVVENGYDDALWEEVYDAMGYMPASLPVLITPGNHDTRRREGEPGRGENTAHPLFNAHFAQPENGPAEVAELRNEVYYVDYQGVRLVSLNANHLEESRPDPLSARCIDAQLAWLDRILAEAKTFWKIVFFHQPVYSVAKGRDNAALRERLRPLFEKHGVHLALQGHDHTYGRTFKCAGDRTTAGDAPGVVYVTSVLGPKLYDLGPKFAGLMTKQYEKTRSVQSVRITPEFLEYRSVGLDGTQLDGFVLSRKGDGELELRET